MPYIAKDARQWLDMGARPSTPGELNYTLTSMVLKYLRGLTDSPRYEDYNTVVGVLECVKQEFYRRSVSVYEDQKAADNGDLEWVP